MVANFIGVKASSRNAAERLSVGARFTAGPPQGEALPLGGQRRWRSHERGGNSYRNCLANASRTSSVTVFSISL